MYHILQENSILQTPPQRKTIFSESGNCRPVQIVAQGLLIGSEIKSNLWCTNSTTNKRGSPKTLW